VSGTGHGHGHQHVHAGGRHRWRLAIVFALVAGFFVVEMVAGLLSGSLALISDAGHMAADVVALGAALVTTKIATRPDLTGRRTYGSYRAEVFASGLTVLIMLGVSAYVVIEAIARIGSDVTLQPRSMLLVGFLGLLVNAASMVILRRGAQESLNVKGAYYEVVADAAGSIGVIAAGVLVSATGKSFWDTAVAVAIGLFIAIRAIGLGRQVVHVLGQHVPENLDLDQVVDDLASVGGVQDVHDLHIWTLTSGMNVATAHLVLRTGAEPQGVLTAAQALLHDQHHIEHATLQVETKRTRQCYDVQW